MTAKNIALGIVIGGSVSGTLQKSLGDAQKRIGALSKAGEQARMFQRAITDTVKLKNEISKLGASGGNIDSLTRKLDAQTAKLRKAGIEVRNLEAEYARMARAARGVDLKMKGMERIESAKHMSGSAVSMAAKTTAAIAVPTYTAAEYQSIIRDISIKAGITDKGQEDKMSSSIVSATRDKQGKQFISRNDLAQAVNEMVGGGMEVNRAVGFAGLAAKFSVGQNAPVLETAQMIKALEQNAKITDTAKMEKALESIAFLGKAGSFESKDMARWFPELLAEMQKIGVTGLDSVNQLGAMLQVQMKVAGSSDQAANNLKNWFSKIGSGETEKQYDKQGINYSGEMKKAIAKGKSPLEASLDLALKYVEKTDPAKAKELSKAISQIANESDPEKIKRMQGAFEETMKTGDLFADMQVKSALTAYMQNKQLYDSLKKQSQSAAGDLEKDLEARRTASKQIWEEVGLSTDRLMKSIGDSISPITDSVGKGLASVAGSLANIADESPKLAAGLLSIMGAVISAKALMAGAVALKGGVQLARGAALLSGAGTASAAAAGGAGAASTGAAIGGAAVAGAGASKAAQALAKIRGVASVGGTSLLVGGRAALAAPSLGAISGGGAIAASGLGVAASGAAGYGIGTLLAKGIDLGLSKALQRETSLGAMIYNLSHPEKSKPSLASHLETKAAIAKEEKPRVMTINQGDMSFAPKLEITVKGDVKDPSKLAAELMPYLKRLFVDFNEQQKRAALHDGSHL